MTDLHHKLAADHARLDRLWESFTAVARGGSDQEKADAMAEFESTLLAHFEGEEKYLFPLLTQGFPDEVLALREEHEAIKRQIAELMSGSEVPVLTESTAKHLVTALRRHAKREDELLYSVVNDAQESDRYRTLLDFLENTYNRLRHETYD
jgi:hemerythrin superfamily protein